MMREGSMIALETQWTPRIHKLCLCLLGLCLLDPGPRTVAREHTAEEHATEHPGSVEIQMRNVNFRLTRDIALEVRSLRGQLQRTRPDAPVTFDDPESFLVEVSSAEVAVTPASLTTLMNSYVLAYPDAPIKHLELSIRGQKLIQKGTLHKGIDLPFEIEGSLSVTEDGNIRVHAEKIKSEHLPVKGLLHLFGEDLSKLLKQRAERGMQVVGDDIILMPRTLTPAPHLQGRVSRVAIADGKIVQYFDSGRPAAPLKPPVRASGFLYHRGGVLRFGKLTMNDADLEIVGDKSGTFDFFQREYLKQLVNGYSKTTASNGLVAHMADYSHFESNATRSQKPQSEERTTR
jgi:hypothetical protein